MDNDSKTTFVNEQMVKILGYDGNEMLGRSILDFMDADAKKDAVRYMQRRLQGVAES
ncbi:MAG: PAS domain S-box protein [Actinomycetia bacterium]|nr:PAS domain S-box protein [Actinomycetes bacterium]